MDKVIGNYREIKILCNPNDPTELPSLLNVFVWIE